MDTGEKSLLIETLMAIQSELAASRADREKQQHVHVHLKPRVSIETVVLSFATSFIALACFWFLLQPALSRALP